MTGLQLAKEFYEFCQPKLYELMPQLMEKACAGLCGEGSECFGCDDKISRDHDFSAAFCLWLPEDLLIKNKSLLTQTFAALPDSFQNFPVNFGPFALSRRGPLSIERYYKFFTGLDHAPDTWEQWLSLSENQLAAAVNGEIFEDNGGYFSAWRQKLAYYPHDIRLKKLAARCMQMAQSGQYNLVRCLQRGEFQAAFLARAKFAEAAIYFVFLANKRYAPFYKWAPRIGKSLPILGTELGIMLEQISSCPINSAEGTSVIESVENFCTLCATWLLDNDLSDVRDNWLWAHGPEIIKRINNPKIQNLNLLQDTL